MVDCHCEGATAPSRAGCRATEAISRSSAKQPAQRIPPALAGDYVAAWGRALRCPFTRLAMTEGGARTDAGRIDA